MRCLEVPLKNTASLLCANITHFKIPFVSLKINVPIRLTMRTVMYIFIRIGGAMRMQAKLTLKMDKDVIESMKCYAANNKKSLSRLVEDFFKTSIEEIKDTISISPLVKELTGIISEKDMDNAGYIDYLEKKYD